jgi:hypothetical protein
MKRNSLLLLGIFGIFLTNYRPVFSQEPEDITIERDSVILKGKFYKASGDENKPVVILLQGSPGNTYDVLGLGRSLSMSGINAMTFNYSGSHQSTGTFSFPNCQADIGATFSFLHLRTIILSACRGRKYLRQSATGSREDTRIELLLNGFGSFVLTGGCFSLWLFKQYHNATDHC